MELWVRSQDKVYLIKVKSLLVEENDNYNTWQIFGDSRYLGTYKTRKRALEVLDEIQNILKPKIIYTQQEPIETYELGVYQLKQDVDMKIQEINRVVYEMPQE